MADPTTTTIEDDGMSARTGAPRRRSSSLSSSALADLGRAVERPRPQRRVLSDDDFVAVRERDLADRAVSVSVLVWSTLGCLALAALLVSGKLVEIAERQPFGPERDRLVTLAEGVDRVANALSLNRPYDVITDIRGFGDAPGQGSDVIVGPEPTATAGTPTADAPDDAAPAAVAEPALARRPATPPTTTVPGPLRAVDPSTPLRIHVAGDSQAEYLGQEMAADGGGRPVVVTVDARISTSLARPDFFNWPQALAAVAAASDPEAVVLFIGGNDHQDMQDLEGVRLGRGTPEWEAEWARRLEATFDTVAAPHRHVFWVLQPPMRDGTLNEGAVVRNRVATRVAEGRADVTLVDTWDLLDGDGGFRDAVPAPGGGTGDARQDDGVHLTRTASGWLADEVLVATEGVWEYRAEPPPAQPAPAGGETDPPPAGAP